MTANKASKQCGITKMTLSDQINNKCKTNKVGRALELTEVEEKSFKFFIDYMPPINYPLTISAIKAIV